MVGERFRAGDICSRVVVVAERATTVQEAAQRMREQHVGCLVVLEGEAAGRRVAGVLTDRDIVTGVVAKGLDARALRVEDVMAPEVVTAGEADSVPDLMAAMQRHGLRRLPVVGGRGELLGLVTLDDLLCIVAEQTRALAAVVEAGTRVERVRRP